MSKRMSLSTVKISEVYDNDDDDDNARKFAYIENFVH